MKVLEVLDSYYPKTDGPNNVITFYAENLNEIDGVEAEIFVPKTKNYKDVQKFVVHRVKSLPAVEGYEMAVAEMDRHVKKYLKNNKNLTRVFFKNTLVITFMLFLIIIS